MTDRVKALVERRLAGTNGLLPDDEESRRLYPTVWQFMTWGTVSEQIQKDLATIKVSLGLGQWIVELTDPSLEVSLTVAVSELKDLLGALEAAVSDSRSAWKPWRQSAGKFRRVNKQSVPPANGT